MLAGKIFPRPAEPRHHLVKYQKDVITVAYFSDLRKVFRRGADRARDTVDGFSDKCGHVVLSRLLDGF